MKLTLSGLVFCASISAAATAWAQEDCGPAVISPTAGATGARVHDYEAVFESCAREGDTRLATRRLRIDSEKLLLTVDPQSLKTSLERAACWRCVETGDAEQAETRFMQAVRPPQDPGRPPALVNAGLIHGKGAGAFITGDLCPSHKPLDRGFIEEVAAQGPGTPLTLAVSGAWIAQHGEDFAWLQEKARSGALDITWADHSYSHPYIPGLRDAQNYLLRPGVDLDREIFETEKILIAHGETPSVFFRFPGLVSDGALLEKLKERHLVALGADSWLALGPPPKSGSIVLVHPNGNEPGGLQIFSRLLKSGRMPKPFRAINEAP
ncbi:polysaccharide deacetylase [Methylocystis sp. MJC1]|uniref:polysaccharide deacetylase family protein n=1 Tax=Methylocystis sp. MJC1 TaxID=2654282 RepID=UPI001FEEB2E3|nr:polysaccharide deacetylase [Methylocystis sp. MJC1]UZX11545.1 polysaccharide deacetylase [Methylocystis sp. MJC1]